MNVELDISGEGTDVQTRPTNCRRWNADAHRRNLQVSAGRITEAIAFGLAWFAILGVYLVVRRNRARTTI